MIQRALPTFALALLIAVAAGCGGSGSSSSISPGQAKSAVEHATGVHLTAYELPAGADSSGVKAMYTNQTTAGQDNQVVVMIAAKDSGTVSKVKDLLTSFEPASVAGKVKVITHDNIVVLYAPLGVDHHAKLAGAVNAL